MSDCVCGEINTRHCPVHGQNDSPERDLLCGHWTLFGPAGKEQTVRCELPQGHAGMHKVWPNPPRPETFSWAGSYERHRLEA